MTLYMQNLLYEEKQMFNNKCCQCLQEPCCCCIGPTGPVGPQGPTGPTGSGFTPAYGTFYNNQDILTATGALPLLTFLAVPPVGLSHTPGSSIVTVIDAGVYNVTYGVNDSGSTPFALRINGAVLPGSIIYPFSGSLASGWATLALAAGNTIEIVLTEPSETLINRVIMNVIKVNQ